MRINREKLAKQINLVVADIKELKSIFRESGQPRLKDHYMMWCRLGRLKDDVTLLCSIQAHSRGRIHKKGSSLEEQADFIDGCYEDYKMEKQAA